MPAKLHLFKCQFVFISMLRLFSIRMLREVNRDNSLEFIMIFLRVLFIFHAKNVMDPYSIFSSV